MNLEFLKKKVEEQFKNVEAFAQAIGVSKQAVYDWLGSRSRPEENRTLAIVEALQLSEPEIDALFGVAPTRLLFRKKGLRIPDAEVAERCQALAETFFKTDGTSYIIKDSFLSIASSEPASIANYIRTLLGKQASEPVTIDDLLNELKKHNISVFFLPFGRLGLVLGESNSREVAFTARKGSRAIIFVDTDRTVDEATLDLCHELVHLVLNHEQPTSEDERLCTRVACELIYPPLFFKIKESDTRIFADAKGHSWNQAAEKFLQFSREFDWSPKGLALALREHGIIKGDSHEFKRLMVLHSKTNNRRRSIDEVYFSKFDPSDYEKLLVFFVEEVQKNQELFRPLIEIRDAAAFGRISPRRVADILNIDSGDADELIRSWTAEQEAESSQATEDDSVSKA